MNRYEFLRRVSDTVQDREQTHGKPSDNFRDIAAMWQTYLGISIKEEQVAYMMVLMKVARSKSNGKGLDNLIDTAGYVALATELIYGNLDNQLLPEDQQSIDSKTKN